MNFWSRFPFRTWALIALLCAIFAPLTAHADYIYTFERISATHPYSFSFRETTLLTTTTANLNIGTVNASIYSFDDSALGVSGNTFCFAFGSGTTDAFSSNTGCGLQHSPVSGVTALFSGANHVGTFNVISGTSFSYPNTGFELTRLTIAAVPEPASLMLLLAGAGWLLVRPRR